MLRSFAYAAARLELLRGVARARRTGRSARARRSWRATSTTVEPALLPPGQDAIEQLLAVFELEKAVYELRYELNNRPDWVGSRWPGSAAARGGRPCDREPPADLDAHRPPRACATRIACSAPTPQDGGVVVRAFRPAAAARHRAPEGGKPVELSACSRRAVRGRDRRRQAAAALQLEVDYADGEHVHAARSVRVPADARRARPAPRRRGPPRGALRASSARTCASSTASPAPPSRSGRRRARRSRGRRLQLVGRAPAPDARARLHRHLGALRPRHR